jgi:hypothetical protein
MDMRCPFVSVDVALGRNALRPRLRTYLGHNGAGFEIQASELSMPLQATSSSLTASTDT